MEPEDFIELKKGDMVKIKIENPRLFGDKKYNGKTGLIVDTIGVRCGKDIITTSYVVYLHRKRELCAFSRLELILEDKRVLKKRLEEVRKRLQG